MSRRALLAAVLSVLALLRTCPLPVSVAQQGESSATNTHTFRELGFDDETARTMYGSVAYFFPVLAGRAPQPGAQIELLYSYSPLVLPDRSTITVIVNAQPVATSFLPAENRENARLLVPLPVAGFSGSGFFVEVAFLLHLTRDGCEDAGNPGLWATVSRDSRLTLPLSAARGAALADLPGLLLPSAGVQSAPLPISVPVLSPQALRAAGLVAFQYGRWAEAAGRDALVEASTGVPTIDRGGVIVGTGDVVRDQKLSGSLRWEGRAFSGPDGPVPPEAGVLALTTAPTSDQTALLVVSGATPDAVATAAEALVQPERRDLLTGTAAIVTGAPIGYSDAGRPWRDGAASFAQLGVEGRDVVGPGLHTLLLTFERPPGWILEDGGALELMIASTPDLRHESSWVAARVNGIDLGTQRLDRPAAEAGRYRFALPAQQLTTDLNGQPQRRLSLEVRIFLDIPDAGCVDAMPASAQATLLASSAWRLPHRSYQGLDLGRFPAMFFSGKRAPVTVVLPANPSPTDLSAALTLMAALGRWSGSDDTVWPLLTTANSVTDEDRGGHLVMIGGPEQNALSAAAQKRDRTLFKDSTPPLLAAGGDWGALQLIRSPFGRSRALLALFGSDASGVRLAAEALATAATLARIHGRTVMLSAGLPPQMLAGPEPAEPPPADLAPRAQASFLDRIEPWQIAGAFLLGTFAATVALVLLVRLRRRT